MLDVAHLASTLVPFHYHENTTEHISLQATRGWDPGKSDAFWHAGIVILTYCSDGPWNSKLPEAEGVSGKLVKSWL